MDEGGQIIQCSIEGASELYHREAHVREDENGTGVKDAAPGWCVTIA